MGSAGAGQGGQIGSSGDTSTPAGGTLAGAGTAGSSANGATSSGGGSAGQPATSQGGAGAVNGGSMNAGSGGTGGSGAAGSGNSGGKAGSAAAGNGGSGGGNATPSVSKNAEGLLSSSGLSLVSYGGYLNGEAFQQDGLVTFAGQQYAAFWNASHHVVLARRTLPSGAWQTLEFTDYTNTEGDAHNTISIGICAGDGTLHLAFDHHGSDLHYRRSLPGLLSEPSTAAWSTASFSAVGNRLVANTAVTLVTYPRFVSEPGGKKMLFDTRIGGSGSGDEYLWEYDSQSHAWQAIGMYIFGSGDSINAYLHGLSYGKNGTRLHAAWCWRETPDANTNHELIYAYSDDNGRTWKNNAGATVATSGTSYITRSSPGIGVWAIKQNRGLINQEHLAVDADGRVHVLLSHMPDAQADDANFDSSRSKSQSFHYFRNATGIWTRRALNAPVIANFRGKLAVAASGNLYAVLPNLRIAGASVASNFSDWSILDSSDAGKFFSDPLIDTSRLLSEDKLTVFAPQKSSGNISVIDYTLR